MRTGLVLLAILCVNSPVSADTLNLPQRIVGRPSAWVVAGEAGSALGLGVVGGLALGALGFVIGGSSPDFTSSGGQGTAWVTIAGGSVGYAAGTGLGAWAVGRRAKQEGKAGGAFLGAAAGLAVGAGIAGLGGATKFYPLIGLAFAAPPAGAVIGYNISRPKGEGSRSFNGRLELPQLAVRQERLADRSGVTVYDAKLVSVRF